MSYTRTRMMGFQAGRQRVTASEPVEPVVTEMLNCKRCDALEGELHIRDGMCRVCQRQVTNRWPSLHVLMGIAFLLTAAFVAMLHYK